MTPSAESKLGIPELPSACYLYCVAENAGEEVATDIKGVEGNIVYQIAFRDLVVLLHNCEPQPYNSSDEQQMLEWVLRHEEVVEEVSCIYSNVLPFAFNTIIIGVQEEKTAIGNLLQWFEANYTSLKTKLDRIRGKKEYVVKIFMDCRQLTADIMVNDAQLKALGENVVASTKGKSFFIKEKINALVKQKISIQADVYFHKFYESINNIVRECRIEKNAQAEKNQLMLMNLSCLADMQECLALGKVLDEFNSCTGINISFSGPWPPYSFV